MQQCNLAMFKTFSRQPAQKQYGYLNGDEQILLLYVIITDFVISLIFTTFGLINPRNLTSFTRPFLAGRRVRELGTRLMSTVKTYLCVTAEECVSLGDLWGDAF